MTDLLFFLDSWAENCYNMKQQINLFGLWVYRDGEEEPAMRNDFIEMIRSNFRCGRMLDDRADRMAGRFQAPVDHMCM